MGVSACKHTDAGGCSQQGGGNDPPPAQACAGSHGIRWWPGALIAVCLASATQAESLRIATYAAPLSRDGPGLLLRDLIAGDDPTLTAIVGVIDSAAIDVLVLTDVDYDRDNHALGVFASQLARAYDYRLALIPNTGIATGLDMDGNGRTGEPRDAQGYGVFAGDGGMAILSTLPIGSPQDLSHILWKDLPGATLPPLSEDVAQIQRLSSTGHWVVPIDTVAGTFSVLAFSATPPVFDGPEDRNGLRNRDELRLWELVLDGAYGPAPQSYVIAGNANLDPLAGDGIRSAMAAFLADPRVQDPLAEVVTARWPTETGGPGDMRVSYVLPSPDWTVADAGIMWPSPAGIDLAAGPHGLVWLDITR